MIKQKDFSYYFFLIIILSVGLSLIYFLAPNKSFQMIAAAILCLLYAFYGITHHLLQHSLVGKVVVEYILVAVLGIAITIFVFRGGFGF